MMQSYQKLQIIKFRSFVSKQSQGFVIIFNVPPPEIIFEDILYQLFEPIFPNLLSPEIYYFSTSDQMLSYKQMINTKNYIYVHFLHKVKQYEQCYDSYGRQKQQGKLSHKFKLGDINELGKGIDFEGNNLYIFSEESYSLYGKQIFKNMVDKKICTLSSKYQLKQQAYRQYMNQLTYVKNNGQFIELKQEIDAANEQLNDKINKMENITDRYGKAKVKLASILRSSGIQIKSLKDLF